jgi:hypothetical protein
MLKLIPLCTVAILLAACGDDGPPVINTEKSSIAELKAYQDKNCQDKYKMHPYCIDAHDEWAKKRTLATFQPDGKLK